MDNPETLEHWEIRHWMKTNKITTEKPIKMRAIKNGQSRDTGNIGK